MKMNPLMNRRNVEIVVETRGVSSLWESARRKPEDWAGGDRR